MDFVVFGFGVSALLMLGGFGLRDLGPWLFGAASDDYALPEFEDAKATIRKQTLASIGNAVSAAGAGVALVTVAALFGKTTDEIGAIVVGMSLVLAAVGVGAWSYDIFRRYRSAMDIVTAQENSVRSRIQARDARDRAMRPQPKPESKTTPKPAVVAVETVAESESTTTTPAPETVSDDPHDEIDLDAPLPAWHDEEPTSSPEFEPVVTPVIEIKPEVEPAVAQATTPVETPIEEITPLPPVPMPVTTTTTTTSRPLFRTTMPPVPLDDTLIDEAVRIEPTSRFSSRGNAPSWLFDDLETDLDQQGSDQDDPIDRFREAKPVSRPSALERLLAEDKAKRPKPTGDDTEG